MNNRRTIKDLNFSLILIAFEHFIVIVIISLLVHFGFFEFLIFVNTFIFIFFLSHLLSSYPFSAIFFINHQIIFSSPPLHTSSLSYLPILRHQSSVTAHKPSSSLHLSLHHEYSITFPSLLISSSFTFWCHHLYQYYPIFISTASIIVIKIIFYFFLLSRSILPSNANPYNIHIKTIFVFVFVILIFFHINISYILPSSHLIQRLHPKFN